MPPYKGRDVGWHSLTNNAGAALQETNNKPPAVGKSPIKLLPVIRQNLQRDVEARRERENGLKSTGRESVGQCTLSISLAKTIESKMAAVSVKGLLLIKGFLKPIFEDRSKIRA